MGGVTIEEMKSRKIHDWDLIGGRLLVTNEFQKTNAMQIRRKV